MNGCRAASASRARRGRRIVLTAGMAGLLAALAAWPAPTTATAAPPSPITWIAAQVDPLEFGLDPVAGQISRDGGVVGFVTIWSGIDPGDVGLDPDVFEYRVGTGQTARVNITPGAATYGNGWLDSFSASGSIMSFTTGTALDPADTNGVADVYVLDRSAGVLQRVSADQYGQQLTEPSGPSMVAADGNLVAFAGVVNPNAPRGVWVRDRRTGAIELVSVAGDGTPANAVAHLGSVSDDGRWVSFWSAATNLPRGSSVAGLDFFVRDRLTGTTIHGIPGTGTPEAAVMSGDGNVVAYVLNAASDLSRPRLVHVWDRRTNLDRVLHLPSPFSPSYVDWAAPVSASADGRYLVLEVPATPSDHLAVTVAVYDTATDAVAFPAVDTSGAVVTSDARAGSLSADGTKVLFTSWADGLAPNDANHDEDLFLRVLDPSDFGPAPSGNGLLAGPVGASTPARRVSVAPAASVPGGGGSRAARPAVSSPPSGGARRG